jgi:hypothetical protein
VALILIVASLIIIAYWAAWALHRSLVASGTSLPYVTFEDAFPLADFLLVVLMLLGAWALQARRPSALAFLLLGAGGGLYLFCMDVLYDLQHGVWGSGANGVVELGINIVTLALSVFVGGWAWRHRDALLDGS